MSAKTDCSVSEERPLSLEEARLELGRGVREATASRSASLKVRLDNVKFAVEGVECALRIFEYGTAAMTGSKSYSGLFLTAKGQLWLPWVNMDMVELAAVMACEDPEQAEEKAGVVFDSLIEMLSDKLKTRPEHKALVRAIREAVALGEACEKPLGVDASGPRL